jgi:hypothetical protein
VGSRQRTESGSLEAVRIIVPKNRRVKLLGLAQAEGMSAVYQRLTVETLNVPAELVAALVSVSLAKRASYVEVFCVGKGCSAVPSIQARNSL